MPLPFRQRIFVILVALTAVPTALAVVGWALAVRTVAPSAGARVALEEMTASARLMVDRMDTTHLSVRERAAFREHLEQLSNSVTLARRAETYLRYYAGGFAAVVFVLGAFAVIAAVRVAGHLSRQLSRPIDELVGWTRLIRRRMPLPAGPPTCGGRAVRWNGGRTWPWKSLAPRPSGWTSSRRSSPSSGASPRGRGARWTSWTS